MKNTKSDTECSAFTPLLFARPDTEGVWWTHDSGSLPPVVVMKIHGELCWRQVGTNARWCLVGKLIHKNWQKAAIPFFE